LVASSLGGVATVPFAVAAEQASGSSGATLDEITVTAQKRETNIQTTAIAVSAVAGESLVQAQVTNIEGLAQSLPSVNFGQTTGNARIAIRGVGFDNISLGNEGRVAYHVDGVYISRPAAALASFYDVERIEVVRGPQGVLYGRNATGGAVNVILHAPDRELNGYIDGTIGSYSLYKLEGAVGGPLGDSVSGRLSFQVLDRGGYGDNLTNGFDVDDQSTQAVRGQIRFQPSESVDLTLSGDYFTEDDHAYSFHYITQGSLAYPATPTTPALPGAVPKGLRVGGTIPSDLRDSTSDSGPLNDREF
jgi:iron complex outermembrane receptor protein